MWRVELKERISRLEDGYAEMKKIADEVAKLRESLEVIKEHLGIVEEDEAV